MKPRIFILTFVLFLAACTAAPNNAIIIQSAQPTSTTPPEPTTVPTETPTLIPSPTPIPPISKARILLGPGGGSIGGAFIDPGAVVYHDGQLHMFYNGIDSWPSNVEIGYATSENGQSWTRQTTDPIFDGDSVDYADVSIFVSSAVVEDDGTWTLYFYATNSGFSKGLIGRATADSPFGPFIPDPAPVLELGPDGAWDSFAQLNPHVIKTEDGYVMYYDGSSSDANVAEGRAIGMATSPDGITWTKYDNPETTGPLYAESDPVFLPDPNKDAWDHLRVVDPAVIQSPDGWVMIYDSYRPNPSNESVRAYYIGIATSQDGITWERRRSEPLISTLDRNWFAIYLSTAAYLDDTLFVFFDVSTSISAGGTSIYMSTINDLNALLDQ